MLTLEPLQSSRYRQVAEWEHGPQPDADWESYATEMNEPKWTRYGLHLGDQLVGCVSLEHISRNMVAFHVVTQRRAVHPDDLARALFDIGDRLFQQGILACVAYAPIRKREVARLASRCGMVEYGHDETMRYFIVTKKRFERQTTSNRI